MKKYIAILMLIAILLSCCACAAEETPETSVATQATEATEENDALSTRFPTWEEMQVIVEERKTAGQPTPEELYGMINQLEPIGGVYKIWSAVGVQNMADHPDAKFEFLCNVDMGGQTLRPIGTKDQPFTGEISGVNCTISNFTIEASQDGYLGFVGVNNGVIRNLTLDNVTFVSKENTKYIGGIAAVSTTQIGRCTVRGTMDISQAAEDAVCGSFVGQTSADVINSVADVDIHYTAAGKATIGGIIGVGENLHMEFTETYGDLIVEGDNKQVGLILGAADTVDMYTVSFLGEQNQVNGQLHQVHFGSGAETTTYETLLTRDNAPNPLPENVQKLRDIVEQRMREMGTIEWSTTENLYHDCVCQLGVCYGAYTTGKLHRGIPYNHKGGSLARFMYCMTTNEYGQYVADQWTYGIDSYDGFDLYIGNDCSGAVQNAWWAVSNSTDILSCQYMQTSWNRGTIAVGDWPSDITVSDGTDSAIVVNQVAGREVMFDAFAQLRKGDAIMHVGKEGNHTRLVAADAVLVRDENGAINGDYSYVLCHEQGAPAVLDPYFCSWRIDYKYTFNNMYLGGYMPFTCEELLTGEMEPSECAISGNAEGYTGMFTGEVKANYHLEAVTLTVTDSQGKEAFKHTMWVAAERSSEYNSNRDNGIRNYHEKFNMAKFAVPLQYAAFALGESYSYTISAYIATGETFDLATGSFVYGSAQ